ncbi:protein-glutamate O-methyltransferase CheR [soil metagenome]
MTDPELVAFLQGAVPRLGLRWKGLRDFRRTVKKRLVRRMTELGLGTLDDYRARLEADPREWARLDAMCRITISRLYRDHAVYERLGAEILPARARVALREGRRAIRVWSAGCASGEEPYSVAIVWHVDVAPAYPGVALELLATDADDELLARARRATYGEGSLRELDARLREAAFTPRGSLYTVRPELRAGITFVCQDLRRAMPDGPFDVVLCRNVLLTYVEEGKQRALVEQMVARIAPGGALVVGSRETMPAGVAGLEARLPGVFTVAG